MYVLADLQFCGEPIFEITKFFRSQWVEKFGKDVVERLIDPMPAYNLDDVAKTLIYDCSEMKKLADEKNATLILMTYPFYTPDEFRLPPNIYTRISKYLDVILIDNNTFFKTHLKTYRKEEIFSTDGHCTAKGYGLLAQDITAELERHNLLP